MGTLTSGYKVERVLEEWSNGALYVAYQASLQRKVLLRLDKIKADSAGAAEKERLLGMARRLGGLNHPNVVRVLEAGDTADGIFFSMEYPGDATLEKLLKEKGRLTPKEVVGTSLQILTALEYALAQDGLTHGELQPQVIYMMSDGYVKVAEFGMGRRRSRVQMGREAQYVAPERASGGSTDERSDIYSLGAILYRSLSGRLPFPEIDPRKVLANQVEQSPKPLSEVAAGVPVELTAIVETAMRKDPRTRYQNPGQMAAALRNVIVQ